MPKHRHHETVDPDMVRNVEAYASFAWDRRCDGFTWYEIAEMLNTSRVGEMRRIVLAHRKRARSASAV